MSGCRASGRPGGALPAGEPASEVIAIGTGRVRLSSVQPSGLATTIEDSGPGDVLGEFDVLRNKAYSLTAVALVHTTGVVTGRGRFREVLLRNPGHMLVLLERAVAEPTHVGGETEKEEQVRFDVFRSALANGDDAVLRLHFARHPQDLPKFLSLLEAAPQDGPMLRRLEGLIDQGLLTANETEPGRTRQRRRQRTRP